MNFTVNTLHLHNLIKITYLNINLHFIDFLTFNNHLSNPNLSITWILLETAISQLIRDKIDIKEKDFNFLTIFCESSYRSKAHSRKDRYINILKLVPTIP